MGAGRGLIDSTDRTLKEHLALIFPLDVWTEARRKAREKAGKLQELLVVSEATLEADKSVVARLSAAESATREQCSTFENNRVRKIGDVERQIRAVLASKCRSNEDSVAYAEGFPTGSEGLTNMIEDCKKTLRALDERTAPVSDNSQAAAAAALAKATADLSSAEDLLARLEYLADKSSDWEAERKSRICDIEKFRSAASRELESLESSSSLDVRWREASDEMRRCDDRFQELVSINIRQGAPSPAQSFSDQLIRIHSARERVASLKEETVRLETSLEEVRQRLNQSRQLSLVTQEPPTQESMPEDLGTISAGVVTCESCLRPFDGELYAKARLQLQEDADTIADQLRASEKKANDESERYEHAVQTLSELIDKERNKILEDKRTVSDVFSKVRSQRDSRAALNREVQELKTKIGALLKEPNLYLNEMVQMSSASRLFKDGNVTQAPEILHSAEAFVSEKRVSLSKTRRNYEDVMKKVRARLAERAMLVAKKSKLQSHMDELQKLHSCCAGLENDRLSLQSEANPFQESLRMVTGELATEIMKLEKREKEFSNLKDTLNVLKSLDVAFGPRGIPSFVLEEGLVWLEKLTSMYLHQLSAGELMLQIRAFSDYKSANRSDGDNKEVISKRVFVRKHGPQSRIRERSLRQLSGGQRRRCSLAFALAFADLAHERAGFQSSLMVMDEILQALDEDGRQRMSKALPALLAGERQTSRDTVLVVTQDEAPEIAGLAHGGIDVVIRNLDQSGVLLDGKTSVTA